jgi:DNA replication protein DnaC
MEDINTKLKVMVKKVFNILGDSNNPYERRKTYLSFATKENVKHLFTECFMTYDSTIEKFLWLPEYDQVLDWMIDNLGQGLFLSGNCGRGKTDIILGVLVPIYFLQYKKRLLGFHATQLPESVSALYEDRYRWNYEILRSWKVAYIDELGTERMITNFGEKIEPFNEILNVAEQNLNVLLISSNLTGEQFLERYGDRTMDRIKRLCKIVKFTGDSLRS